MLLGQQPQRALSSQFNSQFSFYKNRSQISHQSPVSAVTFFIESTPSLSTSSQIDLYDQRPSQTRRYPPSVSSSPQKDMQPKVRVQLSILALTIQILCLLSTSILFSLYGIWTVVTWDKLLDEVFSKAQRSSTCYQWPVSIETSELTFIVGFTEWLQFNASIAICGR